MTRVMWTIVVAIALASACAGDPNAGYPPDPGGGGETDGNGSSNTPPAPPKDPFTSTPYAVTWTPGPLLDVNGEGTELVCNPSLCATITGRTTISAIRTMADGTLRFAFSSPGSATSTYLFTSKPVKSNALWTVTVAADPDGVGARHTFTIIEAADGVLSASIDWDIENVPQTPDDDQFVHFDFVAEPQ